jgi:hypothetical protein
MVHMSNGSSRTSSPPEPHATVDRRTRATPFG